jgi:MFS family permease
MTGTNGRYFGRNFTLGIVTGAFVNLGMAFVDPVTVLPVFISKLGGSAALVGLVSALHGVGWFLPQIFTSRMAETRRYVMGMYRAVAVLRFVSMVAVVAGVFYIDASNLSLFLAVFIAAFLLANLAGGLAAVPFLEVTSKTIPVTSRGRFFAWRRIIGGTLGIFAGVVVGLVLDNKSEHVLMSGWLFDTVEAITARLGLVGHAFPADFGILFLLGGLCISLGMFTFCFAGEPAASSVEKSSGLLSHLRSGLALLRNDSNYRRFYLVRICWQFTAMAFPFYIGFAYGELGVSERLVGFFLSVWVGSGLLSNYIWGRLMDRSGNKIVLTVTAVMSALPPLVILYMERAVAGGSFEPGGWFALLLISATFFVNGVIRSGRIISNITYLLEFAPEAKRPLYVGFMNSFSFPFMFSPLLGGLILQVFDNRTLFTVSLVFALLNVALSARLREPRQEIPDKNVTA